MSGTDIEKFDQSMRGAESTKVGGGSYSDELRRRLAVRFVRLTFELEFLEDGRIPTYKSSALRGGMGEMLLKALCFRDRDCASCDFEEECTVRRIMYARYPQRPEFVTSGESIGYLITCEDYRESVSAGECLNFTVTLFGKLIVYFNPVLQAFFALGQAGLGKDHTRFAVHRVLNSRKEIVVEKNWVYWEHYRVETLADYVDYRMRQLDRFSNRSAEACHRVNEFGPIQSGFYADEHAPETNLRLRVVTPVSLKHNGAILDELDLEVLTDAVVRRLYMLDMFESIESSEQKDFEAPSGRVTRQMQTVIPRYSSTHGRQIKLRGVRGEIEIDDICKEALAVLLAGEVMHVGKNVSMGFGRIRLESGRWRRSEQCISENISIE